MVFFKDVLLAIQCGGKAIGFISKEKLWTTFLLPILLNLIAFCTVSLVAWYYSKDLIQYFSNLLGADPSSSWQGVIQFVLVVVIRMVVIVLFFKLYRYIILIFYAPILAFVSEILQKKITQVDRPFNASQLVKDVWRGIKVALVNIGSELLLSLVLVVLSVFITPLALLLPFILFGVESYFYGFSMIDYRNEYWFFSARESRKFIKNRKGLAIGVGAMFNLILLIPLLGVLIAPMYGLTVAALVMEKVDPRTPSSSEPIKRKPELPM